MPIVLSQGCILLLLFPPYCIVSVRLFAQSLRLFLLPPMFGPGRHASPLVVRLSFAAFSFFRVLAWILSYLRWRRSGPGGSISSAVSSQYFQCASPGCRVDAIASLVVPFLHHLSPSWYRHCPCSCCRLHLLSSSTGCPPISRSRDPICRILDFPRSGTSVFCGIGWCNLSFLSALAFFFLPVASGGGASSHSTMTSISRPNVSCSCYKVMAFCIFAPVGFVLWWLCFIDLPVMHGLPLRCGLYFPSAAVGAIL